MARRTTLQKRTEKAFFGQIQEDLEPVLSIPTPAQRKPVPDGDISSSVGTPDEKQLHFKRPEQVSTPRDKGALTGEVKHFPAPRPGGDEYTVRTHEEELPVPSEGRFSVQESADGTDQDLPPWLAFTPRITVKAYTSSKDLDVCEHSYKLEVTEDCRDIFKQFPKALGLIVLFASSVAAPSRKLPPVPGVVKGVDRMEDTFRSLGYAVLRLPVNLASWQYKAAMKAVASVSFPESYRHIFVYFTGHGGNDSIDTPDGNLKLVDITNPFSPSEAPHLECLTKIFIFDTSSLSKHSILRSILPHSVLLFPAHPGYPAFARTDDCGLLTQHLAPALRTSSKSFGDIVVDVTGAIAKEMKDDPLWINRVSSESQPLLCQTLKAEVSLLKERMEAMTPLVIIQKVSPTSLSVAVSSPPSSVQFHLQHLHLLYKEGAEQWTHVEVSAVQGGTVMINNLSHGKQYRVKAVAVYPDDEEISTQEMPCDMPTEVEPVLRQDLEYCHVDSVEFEVCQPAEKDTMRWFEVVCQCEETQEPMPIEWPENERVRISELEPGVRYTVTATAYYPNEQSVSITKSFEIPKNDVIPKIGHSESQPPSSVTVSVTAPPQAEKYHLENLSAELRRASDGKLQSKMDQRGKTITFRKLSSSTTYVAKAIATYPNKQVLSDPIQITTSSVPYFKTMCSLLIALLMLSLLVTALTFLILFQPVHVPAVTKYGLQGDTIVVSDFNSFGSASVTITECPEEGDDPRTLKAALVKKSNIIKYTANYTGTINGSATSRVSLLEDEYFLQDSFMAVSICLSSQYSPSGSSGSVVAFVFDSLDENQKFLLNETNGIDSSRYHKALQVGSTSRPICTWVNYTVASPAYYYLALDEYMLGTLAFSADLLLHEIYLNFSDYEDSEQHCSSVSEMQPCTFELHDSLKRKEYVLVSYICSRPEWFSPSTHACTKYKTNFYLKVIVPAALGTVTIISLLSFVLGVVLYMYKRIKKHSLHESHEYVLLRSTASDGN